MKNQAAFHAPLNPRDTEKQTEGCRHTQPDICAKKTKTLTGIRPAKDDSATLNISL